MLKKTCYGYRNGCMTKFFFKESEIKICSKYSLSPIIYSIFATQRVAQLLIKN